MKCPNLKRAPPWTSAGYASISQSISYSISCFHLFILFYVSHNIPTPSPRQCPPPPHIPLQQILRFGNPQPRQMLHYGDQQPQQMPHYGVLKSYIMAITGLDRWGAMLADEMR